MLEQRESYISPVAHAHEPAGQWRKWVGRILLGLVIAGIGWILVNSVLNERSNQPTVEQSELPGPI